METSSLLLVRSLNKEQIRHFRLMNKRYDLDHQDRKDLQLFDLMLKKGDYDDDRASEKIYRKEDKNSFYRLKNRLNEQIEKSLLTQYYGNSQQNLALSYFKLYKLFNEHNHPVLAARYLKKAEKKAAETSSFELLEWIYTEFIRVSNEENINPEEFINKRKESREKRQKLQQLDDVLALLKYRVRVSQNLGGNNYRISALLQKTLKEITGKKDLDNDPVLFFKIYESVSRILLNSQDYQRLESYLSTTFTECIEKKMFHKNNHEIKLQMLVYLVNACFKNTKYQRSLEYCKLLKENIDAFEGLLYEKFIFYYYSGFANNYTVLDKRKAVQILEEALNDKVIVKNSMNVMFLNLQHSLQLFDLRDYRISLKSIQKIYLNDSFKKLDEAFRLKISIFELINRYELRDFDLLDKKIKSLQKDFKKLLNQGEFDRQQTVLEILILSGSGSKKDKKPALKKLIARICNDTESAEGENDLVNYNDWIKASFRI